MNPIVVELANGDAFFIGLGLTVLAFGLRFGLSGRWGSILQTTVLLLGISLVILSAAPIPYWLYGVWLVGCVATRITFQVKTKKQTRVLTTTAFAVFSLVLALVELPYHFAKAILVSQGQVIYVVGDSISAGIGEKEKTWPGVLADKSHLNVVNLARAGATLDTAMMQTDKITATNALILVEIGGNDLLGNTDSRTFDVQLDRLLGKLKSNHGQIVMLELPLLPFWNAYGTAQRDLAHKYGVILIPKKYLVRVFAGKGNTIDGLHLSQQGHDELAKEVYELMKIGP